MRVAFRLEPVIAGVEVLRSRVSPAVRRKESEWQARKPNGVIRANALMRMTNSCAQTKCPYRDVLEGSISYNNDRADHGS